MCKKNAHTIYLELIPARGYNKFKIAQKPNLAILM